MKMSNKGFTLIELLVVTVIIAILAAIAIPSLFGTKERALLSAMRSDLRNLETAQEAYFADWYRYTGTLADLNPSLIRLSPNVTLVIDSASATGWGANAQHPSVSIGCTIEVSRQLAGNPTCP